MEESIKEQIKKFIDNNKWLENDERHTDGFRNGAKLILNINIVESINLNNIINLKNSIQNLKNKGIQKGFYKYLNLKNKILYSKLNFIVENNLY